MKSKAQSTTTHNKKPLRRAIRIITLAMLVSAIGRELRKPAAERTWQGRVWQVVPYDLRVPTWARIRDNIWAPDNPQLFPPRVFGVGWSINLGRAYALLTSAARPGAQVRSR